MLFKKLRADYKWVILVVCFLMEFLCLGFCSSNMGLYTAPVTSALGIDRAVYSIADSIRYITQVFSALAFGALVNRFGTKKMVAIGLCALVGATALRSVATHFLHFYIAGALHGFGIVFVGSTMAGAIVRRWFHQDIGKYTGFYYTASMAAQIVTPMLSGLLMDNFGMTTLFPYATVFVALAFVTMSFVRHGDSRPAPKKDALEALDIED